MNEILSEEQRVKFVEILLKNYQTHTQTEIAKMTGVSQATVSNYAKKLSIKLHANGFNKVCVICGKQFVTPWEQTTVCSDECRRVKNSNLQKKYKQQNKQQKKILQRESTEETEKRFATISQVLADLLGIAERLVAKADTMEKELEEIKKQTEILKAMWQ